MELWVTVQKQFGTFSLDMDFAIKDERIGIFGRGGGFVFNTVHNVQAGVPAENLLTLYEAVREVR